MISTTLIIAGTLIFSELLFGIWWLVRRSLNQAHNQAEFAKLQVGVMRDFSQEMLQHQSDVYWLAVSQLRELADSGYEHLKAKSLSEAVLGNAQKKQYDLNLQYLRNQYDKQEHQEAQKKKDEEPQIVRATDSNGAAIDVDLREIEIL